MAIKHFCDRCEKQLKDFEIKTNFALLFKGDKEEDKAKRILEFCSKCRVELEKFLDENTNTKK